MSIIVPVYNVEQYLRQCLNSLVCQSLQNIEIIAVNDCSPDASEAIILEYAGKDDRIVYIKHEQNKGLGGARNTGIKAARGEYIAFVDSDDYIDVSLYEAALRAFEEHEIDIVCMPFQKFDEKGNIESFYRPHDEVYTVNLDTMLRYSFFNAWSKVYRRADIEKHRFVFPEYMYWEDVPFWMQYCTAMRPRMWNLSDQYGFYWYRGRAQSITGQGYVNYKSVPNMFSFVYADLSHRGLMNNEVFFSFYKVVMQTVLGAWNLLEKKYKAELSENFFAFTRNISFGTAERRIAPMWHRMSKMTSPNRRRLFMHSLMRRLNLRAKIKHIVRYIATLSPWGGAESPLLSIIIPVYNVEEYLRQCLDSLVHQTLKNIEIIVVNDCSPDNSEAIVREYMQRDPRIVYIKHEENKRQGGARNTGILAARGKYITFVDSDDGVDVTLYEAAVGAFEKHEAEIDIVSMPYLRWRENGEVVSFYREYPDIYRVDLDTLIQFTFFSPCVKIYRTSDIHSHKLYFPEHVYWEDIAFWAEYCAIIHPRVMNLNDTYGFYRYRYREGSTTELNEIHYKDIPCMYRALYHNLCRRGLMNSKVFFSFYKIAMQSFYEAALNLQKKYHREFALNFIDFIKEIHFDASGQSCASSWFRIYQKKTDQARICAAHRLLFKLKLKSIFKNLCQIHYRAVFFRRKTND